MHKIALWWKHRRHGKPYRWTTTYIYGEKHQLCNRCNCTRRYRIT
jgi:hypothetical protein